MYIIKARSEETLKKICDELQYCYRSNIAYIGKAAITKSSNLYIRSKQEMGWSNPEGATFVNKIWRYRGFDLKDKNNEQLKLDAKKFICKNFDVECVEFDDKTILKTRRLSIFLGLSLV